MSLHRERFAAEARADNPDLALLCLLLAAEATPEDGAGADPVAGLGAVERLAEEVREVAPAGSAVEGALALRAVIGDRGGFRGHPDDYADLRASLLPDVLRRRRGLPILLSVLYVAVARRAGVAAWPVGLPGHFVVGLGDPAGLRAFVDPFAGGRLVSVAQLGARVGAEDLRAEQLRPWPASDVVLRVLTNIRALAVRTDDARLRLWATDLSLLVPAHPALLRRERGALRTRLGDFRGGARDLQDYAAAVGPADPEAADMALREARMSLARLS